jgi:hypothetical protein
VLSATDQLPVTPGLIPAALTPGIVPHDAELRPIGGRVCKRPGHRPSAGRRIAPSVPEFETDLVSQQVLSHVIGATRLLRLVRAGWLTPAERNAHSVLYAPNNVHRALSRAEHSRCPADRIEIQRIRASELRHGRAYMRKGRPTAKPTGFEGFKLDLSGFGTD